MLDWPIVQDLLNGPFGTFMGGFALFITLIAGILRMNQKAHLSDRAYAALLVAELAMLAAIGYALWSQDGYIGAVRLFRRIDLWVAAVFATVTVSLVIVIFVLRRKR